MTDGRSAEQPSLDVDTPAGARSPADPDAPSPADPDAPFPSGLQQTGGA